MHVKDLLRAVGEAKHGALLPETVQNIATDAYFIPETTLLFDQLQAFRSRREHLAVVVDEYSDFRGIVTLEDILEEIVGDIEDESDREKPRVRRVGEREWIAVGHAEREHLEAGISLILPEGDFETVAGYILTRIGRIPKIGEQVETDGFLLTVNKANERAIQEVHIRQTKR